MQKDPLARSLKNKSFPFYNYWKEIFEKDRATGENSQTFADTVQNLLNKEGRCDPSTGEDQAPKTSHFNSGSQTDFQSDLRAESSSGTKSTGKKRKMHDETDERFIEAINLRNLTRGLVKCLFKWLILLSMLGLHMNPPKKEHQSMTY
ncbi:hypothetical protein ACS0TY_008126 [Phlomoides rotata]